LEELFRVQRELEKLVAECPYPEAKQQIEGHLSAFAHDLSVARENAAANPDRELSEEEKEKFSSYLRTLEMVQAVFANVPEVPETPIPDCHPIQVYIELPGLVLSRWGGVLGNIIQQTLERALIERNLLQLPIVTTGVGFEDFFWLSIAVKDEIQALPVITKELQRMALLSFAQIGQFDGDDTVFLTHYSNRTVRPFQECSKRAYDQITKVILEAGGTPSTDGPTPPRITQDPESPPSRF
jgi:hypothetical protein